MIEQVRSFTTLSEVKKYLTANDVRGADAEKVINQWKAEVDAEDLGILPGTVEEKVEVVEEITEAVEPEAAEEEVEEEVETPPVSTPKVSSVYTRR